MVFFSSVDRLDCPFRFDANARILQRGELLSLLILNPRRWNQIKNDCSCCCVYKALSVGRVRFNDWVIF
jgi:hypothetical protein